MSVSLGSFGGSRGALDGRRVGDHPWCSVCLDTGDSAVQLRDVYDRALEANGATGAARYFGERVVFEGPQGVECRDCPSCAVCRAPLSTHPPEAEVTSVLTTTPYGMTVRWHVVRDCAPEPFGQWLRGAYVWAVVVTAIVKGLDRNTGVQRRGAARVI